MIKVKCSLCNKKAVIELKYANKKLCEKHFTLFYEKRVRRTIVKNSMLRRKDKVAVGVSGGKDSLVLLYLLHKMRYNVEAVLIDEGIKGYRDKTIPYVEKLCKELNIPLHVFSFKEEYGKTLNETVKKRKRPACSYCGVFRRSLLNKAARRINADKLAIGHNLDDETQMILMNFTRSELLRLARAGPVVGIVEDDRFVQRIKPLRECSEKENVLYALLTGIKYSDVECPYAGEAFRSTVRECLNMMEEKHPGTKLGILHSFDKLLPILKEHFQEVGEVNACKVCGEPTSGEICKSCQMKKEIT